MTDLPLTGGCNCGAVRFEVTERLVRGELLPLQALPASQRRRGIAERPHEELLGALSTAGVPRFVDTIRARS